MKTCIAALLLLCAYGRLQAQQVLKGKVINAITSEPVAGASVSLESTKQGTVTNADGAFTLTVPIPDTLVVSHINFITQRIAVNPLHLQPLLVEVEEAGHQQDEVVIIGYGTTSKRFNTGSVSTVTGKIISQQPVTNVLAAIQGRAPGVFVSTQNGLPGGNITVQVRGKNSIDAGNNPLYVIDGVPFISVPLNNGKADIEFASGPISPLNSINPADIESITILKDADATAIYGSRGANGVVLITTKKGEAGATKTTVNFYDGISKATDRSQLLTLPQYLMIRREAFANDSTPPDVYNAPDLVVWDTAKSTNWQQYILGGTDHVQNINAGISGGNDMTSFLIGGNYRHETSILPGEQYYSRGGAHINISHHDKNNRTGLSFTASYTGDKNVQPPPMDGYTMLPPDFPMYNPDGKLNWDLFTLNPSATLMQPAESKTTTLTSNLVVYYAITKALKLTVSGGYTSTELKQYAIQPLASLNPLFGEPNGAISGNTAYEAVIAEPQLNYEKQIGAGKLTVLAGGSWQNSNSTATVIHAINYSNEALLYSLGAAGGIDYINDSYTNYKYVSGFGRVNYNLLQRYILNIDFRRDGSSRFGPGRQYGNFGAAGAAWLFSETQWAKSRLPWLNYGKLRASYGITGNDGIQDYQYMSSYRPGVSYAGVTTIYPVRIANPDYEWETNKKTEIALETGVLHNRVRINAGWYSNRSSNQLVQYPLASQAGFNSYEYNLPAIIENKGWEFELSSDNIKSRLNWTTNVNLTVAGNKLVSFPGIEKTSYASRYVVGQSLDVIKGFRFLGIDPANGVAKYEDVNKDGVISAPADYVVTGNQSLAFYGGIDNSFTYQGFELSIFLQFVKQEGLRPSFAPGFDYASNDNAIVLNRWQNPGDITNVPRAATVYGTEAWNANLDLSTSSAIVTDASYCRFKTVSFSYQLTPSTSKKIGMKQARVFVQAENLFTISGKERTDPELLTTGGGIPPLHSYVAGIEITF